MSVTVGIPVVETTRYCLKVQLDDAVWERIKRCRVPQEVLAQLIEELDEDFISNGCFAATEKSFCQDANDAIFHTPHDVVGVESQGIVFPPCWGEGCAEDLEVDGPGTYLEGQHEWAARFFREE